MRLVLVKCPARVNLSLKINKTNDGVFYDAISDTINIYDELELAVSKKYSSHKIFPKGLGVNNSIDDNRNKLIMKAINAFFEYTKIEGYGVHVKIEKNIPAQIGLGSANSDAAGVILGLNDYFDLHLSSKELVEIAYKVSRDTPYFLFGGYRHVSNDGKNIEAAVNERSDNYVIAQGNVNINWDYFEKNVLDDTNEKNISNNEWESLLPDELLKIKQILTDANAQYSTINGINPTVVGAFNDHHARFKAIQELKKQNIRLITGKPVDGAIISRKFL